MVSRIEHPDTFRSEAEVSVDIGQQFNSDRRILEDWVNAISANNDFAPISMAGFSGLQGLQEAVDSRIAESIGACSNDGDREGPCEATASLENADQPTGNWRFVAGCAVREFLDEEAAERCEAHCQSHLDDALPKVVARARDTMSRLSDAEAAAAAANSELKAAKDAL